MCPEHQRPLELFCDTDEKIVCYMCSVLEHQNHKFVSLEAACERSRSSLQQTQAHTQHMVEQRRLKLQQIQRCVELSDTEVHRERAEGLQVFTALMQSVQRRQELFLEELQEKQRLSHKRAQELVQQLEQEICELQKSSTEAEERLSRSQDPLHFLQHCPALTPPAGLKEWSSVSFEGEECEGSVARALKKLSEEFNKLCQQLSNKAELRRVQKFAVDVTLDPDTAHPKLVLSENLKQVYCGDVEKKLPDSPLRFDTCANVLGKQSFSSGRFYFEVQVKGKTAWDLGVAQESINRKGDITVCPVNGFWSIWLRNKDEYRALADPDVRLSPARAPQKVGVFVDYDEGLVSFYDTDSADLLFSFTGCSFTDKLLPFFSPGPNYKGSNSAPLVVTAVETLRDGKKQSEAPNVKGTSADSTEMWSTSESSSEESVLCSICLEVFSEPVSTPCGHNFCKRCISEAWDTAGLCTCPLCKEVFSSRPELKVNTLLRELVSERKLDKNKSHSMENMPWFAEVQCDVCSEPKLKALKSCLVCLSSFCETHLQPHLTVSGLKRHQLMEPVENLEDRMCPEHQRPLELFCDTDEKIVCMKCSVLEHQNHKFVSLEAACERSRSSLQQTQAHTQHMVEQRRLKLQEIQRCLELSDTEVHRERAEGLQVFTALMQSVQRRQELFLEELQEKQRLSTNEPRSWCSSWNRRSHCPALTPPAGLKEWSSVSFEGEKCEGSVARAVKELEKELSEKFKQCFKAELRRVQKFAVDVTLDPDTASRYLVLSEDLKQVYFGDVEKKLPDSPLRLGLCRERGEAAAVIQETTERTDTCFKRPKHIMTIITEPYRDINKVQMEQVLKQPAVPEPVLKRPAVPEPVLKPPAVPEPVLKPPAVPEPVLKPPAVPEPVLKPPAVPEPVLKPPAVPEPVLKPPAVPERLFTRRGSVTRTTKPLVQGQRHSNHKASGSGATSRLKPQSLWFRGSVTTQTTKPLVQGQRHDSNHKASGSGAASRLKPQSLWFRGDSNHKASGSGRSRLNPKPLVRGSVTTQTTKPLVQGQHHDSNHKASGSGATSRLKPQSLWFRGSVTTQTTKPLVQGSVTTQTTKPLVQGRRHSDHKASGSGAISRLKPQASGSGATPQLKPQSLWFRGDVLKPQNLWFRGDSNHKASGSGAA
ncbi:hypothetical protein WMY93_003225 [Mugilogobius chulae]|uniref:E3 ubiquitin-protein ligase TRIM21-like n=1 Tax=Mugilogobius chulae TaxID=88201 RepID=A0AAW0Q6Y5_9GOBI